jgi:acyl-CoA thioester hydrolase
MPLIHERIFRVRHYECDTYGHVNHANYLRYMQEAAMDASAAAGYDIARYVEMGRSWLIRETNISYHRPLTYGDSVLVRTWVDDFRRVRSRRAYELRHTDSRELVAKGHTDWVYLDTATQRPVTVPEEMITAFYPEGVPEQGPQRIPFPSSSPPPDVFTLRRKVEWHDLDGAGHVNNAMYMVYLEECGVQVAAAYGWPMARMFDAGFGIVARHYRLEYKQPATLGDDLAISTWITEVRQASADRYYTITRGTDGDLIARAHVAWVWIDLKIGSPMRIPPEFLESFMPNLAEGVTI